MTHRLDLRKLVAVTLVLLALLPSAFLAWQWQAMPYLGIYHDDSLYYVTAKSWASGNGHRIESFPGQPAQTKYPPVMPLLLSLAWFINPSFPGNLPLTMLTCWLILPLFVAGAALYFRELGFSPLKTGLLCAWLALNPAIVTFSLMTMSELLFAALLVFTILLAERASRDDGGPWLAAAAGLVAATAFLTKGSALPLLLSVPACLLWRKRLRNAAVFLLSMTPFVVGWQIWKTQHASSSVDMVTLYYTNYFGFHLENISWEALPLIVGQNLNSIVENTGRLFFFFDESGFGLVTLARLLTLGAIVGMVRLTRRTGKLQFPAYAAGFILILLQWHYSPDTRFVVPLLPLLSAGLVEEISHLLNIVRSAWRQRTTSNRVAAVLVASAVAAFGVFAGHQTWYGLRDFLPSVFAERAVAYKGNLAAYDWIRRNTEPDAQFFAYDDPLLYLQTGRRGCSLRIPPLLVRYSDDERMARFVESLPEFADRFDLDHALYTPSDFRYESYAAGRIAAKTLTRKGGFLQLEYTSGSVRVYGMNRDPHPPGVNEPTDD